MKIMEIKNTISNLFENNIKLYEKIKNKYKVDDVDAKFKNVDGGGREEARYQVAKIINKTKLKRGSVLTLPSYTWSMEFAIEVWASKGFNFVACERDFDVFKKMVNKGTYCGIKNKFYHGEVGDLIRDANEDEYSHAILDYCGTLSSYHRDIKTALVNNIVKVGGTITVCLFKARDTTHLIDKCCNYKEKLTGEKITGGRTENAINMFFNSLCSVTDFEVVNEYCYKDGNSPMMVITVKRTK